MRATLSFGSCRVMLIRDGLFPLVLAGTSVCPSVALLVVFPLSVWPPCGVAGEGEPFVLFDRVCRVCGVECFDGEVGVCHPVLLRSTSFFFFINSTIAFGAVVQVVVVT